MGNYIARGRCDICYVANGAKHHDWCEFGEGIPDCLQCVRFREKLDQEKMARVLHRHDKDCAQHVDFEDEDEEAQEAYRQFADALIAYLTE